MAILRYANEGLLHQRHLFWGWTVPLRRSDREAYAFFVYKNIFSTRNWSYCEESSSKIALLGSLFSMHQNLSACRISLEAQTCMHFKSLCLPQCKCRK